MTAGCGPMQGGDRAAWRTQWLKTEQKCATERLMTTASRHRRRLQAAALLLLLLSGPADAASSSAQVRRVAGATLLELADGTRLRLAGIEVLAPDQAAAQALLEDMIRPPARVAVEPEANAVDRHGRLLAQVTGRDGRWLQGRLVELGLALVTSEPGAARRATEMLEIEGAARAAGQGLWGRPDAPVFEVPGPEPPVGRFAIVRGRVAAAGGSRGYVYLNFGPDWRSDFTLRIRRPELDDVLGRSEIEGLVGRLVEARGVVMAAGGPLIEVSHPEQIEVLE